MKLKISQRNIVRSIADTLRRLQNVSASSVTSTNQTLLDSQLRSVTNTLRQLGRRALTHSPSTVVNAVLQQQQRVARNVHDALLEHIVYARAQAFEQFVQNAQRLGLNTASLRQPTIATSNMQHTQARQYFERYHAQSTQRARGALLQQQNITADNLVSAISANNHTVERIVLTETARAFNETQDTLVRELALTTPSIMKRWTEKVSDTTWAPLDKKVAADSMAMHGQLARVDASFIMPKDDKVPAKIWGMQWSAPPNRPHDRAVLTMWDKQWGIPGWILDGDRKKWLVTR